MHLIHELAGGMWLTVRRARVTVPFCIPLLRLHCTPRRAVAAEWDASERATLGDGRLRLVPLPTAFGYCYC